MAMAEERLQKIISQAGIASRRAAEKMILEGRVRVDGKVVRELGTKVNPAEENVAKYIQQLLSTSISLTRNQPLSMIP